MGRRLFLSHQELALGRTRIDNSVDANGSAHQSLLVEGGRIVDWCEPGAHADSIIDAKGEILLPAFNDAHCHILPTGLDLSKLDLRPFDNSRTVLDAIRDHLKSVEPGKWLMAVGYDQTRFSEPKHLTRHDLDSLNDSIPILLRHVSGHASVANSAALRAAGVDRTTPNPPGGEFERDESGDLTGVLLEHAHEAVTAASPSITYSDMVAGILLASESMRAFGIATASDMMTGRFHLEDELRAYAEASARPNGIRYRLFVQWAQVFGPRGIGSERFRSLSNALPKDRCAVAGIKIFADGAIGARTAAIYGQYEGSNGTGDEGQLIYNRERLLEMVRVADSAGYSVAVHAIGDRAVDLVLDAFAGCPDPSKHRLEHAMILSDPQIDRIAKVGCHVTMQPEFLMRFHHAYHKQLGPERARRLKRMRSLNQAGIALSLNSDRPIVGGDPLDGIQAAVTRAPDYIPDETLELDDAISGYTSLAARATQDSDFGTLAAGQLADLVLVDRTSFAFAE